jgi:hypothetical protein
VKLSRRGAQHQVGIGRRQATVLQIFSHCQAALQQAAPGGVVQEHQRGPRRLVAAREERGVAQFLRDRDGAIASFNGGTIVAVEHAQVRLRGACEAAGVRIGARFGELQRPVAYGIRILVAQRTHERHRLFRNASGPIGRVSARSEQRFRPPIGSR